MDIQSYRAIAAIVLLTAGSYLGACGDDEGGKGTPSVPEGGMPPNPGPIGQMDGGPMDAALPPAPPPFVPPTTQPDVTCGATLCPVLTQGEVSAGIGNCCTEADECGITTTLSGATCLAPGALGGADPTCPNLVMDMTMALSGCCTPEGQCGAILSGIGCIANGALMQPEQSCTYDPDNMCTRVLEVTCDGAEDCPGGQICCGQYAGGYRRTACAADCDQVQAEQGGTWAQLCHPGDTCLDPAAMGFACLASTSFLPDFLFRCRPTGTPPGRPGNTAAGMVNCGLTEEMPDGTFRRQVCGQGEKCCVSYPGEVARCAPASEGCPCDTGTSGADAGTDDAGT